MADEVPAKLIQIGPKGGAKKDGFNLVTERVVAVNPETKQLEVELLAYDGKTVVLDVDGRAERPVQRRRATRPGGEDPGDAVGLAEAVAGIARAPALLRQAPWRDGARQRRRVERGQLDSG